MEKKTERLTGKLLLDVLAPLSTECRIANMATEIRLMKTELKDMAFDHSNNFDSTIYYKVIDSLDIAVSNLDNL